MKLKIYGTLQLFLGFLLLSSLCMSCSQDDEIDIRQYGGAPVDIKVMMGGTEEFESASVTRSLAEEYIQSNGYDSVSGMFFETIVEPVAMDKQVQTRASLATNSIFRMLVYKMDGTLAHTCDYTVNGNTVTVAPGSKAPSLVPGEYKFVCYTRNTSTLPYVDGNTIIITSGEDCGTFVGNKTITAADNVVNIIFRRQISQLTIEVEGSGYSNNTPVIPENAITVKNLNAYGSWSANASSSHASDLVINTSDFSKQVSKGSAFYIIPMANKNLSVNISSLQFDGKTYSNLNVPVNGISVARKGNYKMTIKFGKKDISAGISVGGYIWAPGNVYKNSFGNFVFEASQSDFHSEDMIGIFQWNSLYVDETLSGVDYGGYSSNSDPCYNVAPKGTWITPSKNQLQALINAGYQFTEMNGVTGMLFGGSDGVFLPSVGLRKYSGLQTTGGYYWSRDPIKEPLDYEGGKLYVASMLYWNNTAGFPRTKETDRAHGMSVRCVKR